MSTTRTCTVYLADEREAKARFDYHPGQRYCHTQRNGDPGWPRIDPEIELWGLELTDGTNIDPLTLPKAERDALEQQVWDSMDDFDHRWNTWMEQA